MKTRTLKQAVVLLTVAALGAGAGVWWAQRNAAPGRAGGTTANVPDAINPVDAEKKPLYWYDPMFPQQRFDAPGKSPFMDMQLVPKYAEEGDAANTGVKIDTAATQNLGMRLATVTRGTVTSDIAASGVLGFNERDVAIMQAKRAGFVERVFARAPGDVIAAGAPLVTVLVPEWAGAQQEFLALLALGDASLIEAARTRLRLTGMPEALIRRVEQRRKPQALSTIASPIGGVIQSLDVRAGMTLSPGQTLARINGLGTVWLDVAVPEAQIGGVRIGQQVSALLPAYPGETFAGKVSAILPEASLDTRSVRVRVELPNRGARLKPGMTAQVHIAAGDAQSVLRVPSEALIRTGKRTLVMVADKPGRYRPVEVRTGAESGEFTAVIEGLQEGQQVVVSGQFLLDSEASLAGITTQPAAQMSAAQVPAAQVPAAMPLHESQGEIVELSKSEVTIKHGPFKTLNMPGMTMSFPLAKPGLAQSLKVGERVQFGVREADDGLVVERIEKATAR